MIIGGLRPQHDLVSSAMNNSKLAKLTIVNNTCNLPYKYSYSILGSHCILPVCNMYEVL